MAVRVWKETPQDLIDKGCMMIQDGQANPGFFNDDAAIKMVLGKGATVEEARDWNIIGCIQPGPGGGTIDGSPDAGYVNMGKMIEFVLHTELTLKQASSWAFRQEIREISKYRRI